MLALRSKGWDEKTTNTLWVERKKPLTERRDLRETQKSPVQPVADGKLEELVRFLARAAAEADFQEFVLAPTQADCGPQDDTRCPQKGHPT